MAEQQATTPQDVAPEADSFDSKLDKLVDGFVDDPEDSAETQAQPTDEAPASEGDPENLELTPEDEAAAPVGEFELTHNGQKVRVSQEQARNLAQMGYDYSTKMQAVNAEKAKVQQVANALQAQATLQAQMLDHAAVVKSYDMALQGVLENVNRAGGWVKIAQDDPIGYSQVRAQYDVVLEQRNAAYSQAANAYAQHQQYSGAVSAEVRAMEAQKLTERIPEWKDSERYGKEARQIYDFAIGHYGYAPQELQGNPVLDDHRAIAILRDAWKYRQAVAASKGKNLGKMPAAAKPGAAQQRQSQSAEVGILQKQLRQSKDPRAKAKALDALLDKKLFG